MKLCSSSPFLNHLDAKWLVMGSEGSVGFGKSGADPRSALSARIRLTAFLTTGSGELQPSPARDCWTHLFRSGGSVVWFGHSGFRSAPVQSISGAVVPELLCLLPPRNSTDEEARNRSHRSFRSRSESRSPSRNSEPADRNPPRTERRDWRPTALWSTITLSFLVRKTIRMVSPRMR